MLKPNLIYKKTPSSILLGLELFNSSAIENISLAIN